MWIVVVLLCLLAVGSFVIGMIAGCDPEGRGGNVTLWSWSCTALFIGAIVAIAVWGR